MLPYWAMLHYFRTHEREERREERKEEKRAREAGGRMGERKRSSNVRKTETLEKKVRNHKHTHKIKHLLC